MLWVFLLFIIFIASFSWMYNGSKGVLEKQLNEKLEQQDGTKNNPYWGEDRKRAYYEGRKQTIIIESFLFAIVITFVALFIIMLFLRLLSSGAL